MNWTIVSLIILWSFFVAFQLFVPEGTHYLIIQFIVDTSNNPGYKCFMRKKILKNETSKTIFEKFSE